MTVTPVSENAVPNTESAASNQRQLRLISTTPSADGRHVYLHFVTAGNGVTTVQLETSVAVNFYTAMGKALEAIRIPTQHRALLN